MAYPAHLREMISRYDFAATPLGPLPDWPASLRTAVDICVSSPFPMVIFWGPEFRLLYNDAYVPMGAKHPGSLGQPASHIWAEIWPTIGPVLTGVLRTGQVTFSEEQLLIVQRAGYRKRSAVEAGGGGQPASAAIWLDRGARGPLTLEDRVLFGVLSADLGNALARAVHYQQARDLAVTGQHSVIGRAGPPRPGPRPGHDAGVHD